MKGIVILGSTGSIGTQTLDVIRSNLDRFQVIGLAASNNLGLLAAQVQEFKPQFIWADSCLDGIPPFDHGSSTVVPMDEMVLDSAADLIMVATTGRVGLIPTINALTEGKAVALSNKEVVIMAGALIMETARRYNAPVLPVDSEPSAIWQCIRGEELPVEKLIITASGGPFRTRKLEEIPMVTPKEALAHPTWVMGRKITIDSATLMNKGFEVIESSWLFGVDFDHIDVVVHPQSIIHSMVEFSDGSVKAQMGVPDMRLPIQYAMAYPDRLFNASIPKYDPLRFPTLTFEALDTQRYPCFRLALEAGAMGQTYPAALSAADEEAVHLFLDGRIGFSDIHWLVAKILEEHVPISDISSVEAILEVDIWARSRVAELIGAS
jgi:1-deoxy-D-xylulose-5-phosphate reductoisomerase